MKLQKDQAVAVIDALRFYPGRVELECDGYNIVASIQQRAGLKLEIMVYVNGFVKGEWLTKRTPECTKFYRPVSGYLHKKKERDEAAKWLKKRGLSNEYKDYWRKVAEAKFDYYVPIFSSAAGLLRHINKTCQSIKLISTGF